MGSERPALRFVLVAIVGAVALAATSANAQEGHFDALLFQDGGQVQTGGIDVDCFSGIGDPGCDPNGNTDRVYEAELIETGTSPGLIGVADEPGFYSPATGGESALPYGSLLPANASHSVDFIGAPNSPVAGASILFWDGTGAVSWSAVPAGEFFDIEGNAGSGGVLSGSGLLSNVVLDATDANSFADTHPDFFLEGLGGADPSVGFYAIFGRTNIEGLTSSDPWGIVFDFGVENEVLHELAIDNVASFIPEPGTALLLGLGLMGLGHAGRSRRVA